MNANDLKREHLDAVFLEVLEEIRSTRGGRVWPIITTFALAKKLWSKYHVPYQKQVEIVRDKMREWWNSYPWLHEPRAHKMICGVAVNASPPGSYDFCCLEKRGLTSLSLITVYGDQKEFKPKQLNNTKASINKMHKATVNLRNHKAKSQCVL